MILNIQFLKSKKRTLLLELENGLYKSVVFDPKNITNDGKYISIGKYYSDQISGFYNINEISDSIVSIIAEFD